MEVQTAKIHIGKHKTGTTSFQKFLGDSSEYFGNKGFFPLPMTLARRISASSIRDNLPIPSLKKIWEQGEDVSVEQVAEEIKGFLQDKESGTLIVSCEHLSYFRVQSEIDNFRKIFPSIKNFEIYVVLRDKEEFRNSYSAQIEKSKHGQSIDKESPYYCGEDSWLLDDEKLVDIWKKNFENVTVIDYQADGMVEKLIETMSLPDIKLSRGYRFNVTRSREKSGQAKVAKPRSGNLLTRLGKRLRRLFR